MLPFALIWKMDVSVNRYFIQPFVNRIYIDNLNFENLVLFLHSYICLIYKRDRCFYHTQKKEHSF